jgi:hypothetical protein
MFESNLAPRLCLKGKSASVPIVFEGLWKEMTKNSAARSERLKQWAPTLCETTWAVILSNFSVDEKHLVLH